MEARARWSLVGYVLRGSDQRALASMRVGAIGFLCPT